METNVAGMENRAANGENPDVEKIASLVGEVSRVLGLPITQGNKDTPKRVAKMWVDDLFKNRNGHGLEELRAQMTTFDAEEGWKDMVIVKEIDFSSTCEHHWLPFFGTVRIGYIPDGRVLGLSKFPRVVDYFSRRPQLQEGFTNDIGKFLYGILSPAALFVQVEAQHTCVSCRGIRSECLTSTAYKSPGYPEKAYDEFLRRYRE